MISTEIEEPVEILASPEEQYLREVCAFAIALHRGAGLRLIELREGSILRYVVVSRPDGNYHSIHGVHTEKECCKKFFRKPPYEFHFSTEKELRKIASVDENKIKHATQIARTLWPELPWK